MSDNLMTFSGFNVGEGGLELSVCLTVHHGMRAFVSLVDGTRHRILLDFCGLTDTRLQSGLKQPLPADLVLECSHAHPGSC